MSEIEAPQTTPDKADLDLDIIEPDVKHVRLGGKIYEVHPPKIKNIVVITKLARELKDETKSLEEKTIVFEDLKQVLGGVMPAFKSDEQVDLSLDQMIALIEFIFSLVTPDELGELEKLNATPKDQTSTEKKTE